jgi:hypothetical protein
MALFARRKLQRILDENALFLDPKQLVTICNLFNTVRDDYLATEWEQVILNAASKAGTVEHEPALGGVSKPDLWFKTRDQSLEFIADVTTASDRGLHKLNPVYALEGEFWRQLRKAGIFAGGFDVHVDAYPNPVYRGSNAKVRLKLPPRREFGDKIFNGAFHAFLREVKGETENLHRLDVTGPDVGVHFTYDPAKRGAGSSGHLSFTAANVIDQNPVYNALKAKGDQLKAVGHPGITGIFLCDGGCEMLRSTTGHWASFSVAEVIHHFFRQFGSVSFVATFVVRENHRSTVHDPRRWIDAKLHLNPRLKLASTALEQTVMNIHALLPQPQDSPENAMYHLRSTRGKSGRHIGELQMGGNVKMSARDLLELLAGTKTIKEFEAEYRFDRTGNPFHRMLKQGRLISNLAVEHHPEKDDDIAILEFGQPDPAVAPFLIEPKPE